MKIFHRIIAIFTLLMCVANMNVMATDSYFTNLATQISEIETLINTCKDKKIATDYQEINLEILKRFSEYLKEDIQQGVAQSRVEYTKKCLLDLYNQAKNELNGYLSGTKKSEEIPRYVSGKVTPEGRSMMGDVKIGERVERRPIFFTGYGHFNQAKADIPNFPKFGNNIIQTEIGPSNIIYKKTTLPIWNVYKNGGYSGKIELDSNIKKAGRYSAKITSAEEMSPNKFVYIAQPLAVKPNTKYYFGLSAKGENVENTWFSIKGFDNRESLNGTYDWKDINRTYTTGANETTLQFMVLCEDRSMGLNIDNLYVREGMQGENLLMNGDFETESEYAIDFFALKELQETLKKAQDSNIAVSLLISPHYFPEFLFSEYPDLNYNGRGFIRYNIIHPKVKEVLDLYFKVLLPRISQFSSLNNICLSNEPDYQVSHIDAFTPKWQNYLREIYAENLKKLNEVYKSSYLTFESIPMPRNPETLAPLDDKTPVSYDFMNFNNKMVGDFHKYLSSEVKKYIPAIPVHAKQMQHMFSIDWSTYRNPVLYGSDPEIFAEFSDIMGNDSWQCLEQDNYKNTRTHEKLLWYDMQRSIKEAPIYNSEDHIIYDGDQNYIPEHAKRVYTDLWQGAISGRTMSTIWLWEKTNDITSQISGSVLTRPDCIKRIGDVNLDLNRLAYEVTAFQNAKSDVGLLYSNASRAYSLAHSANVHNSYQALVENGQKVEIITEKSIKKIHDYKMLVIPEVVNLPKADLDEISTYSKNGGKIVILGNKSLLKDEKNIDHDLSIVNSIYGKANLIETQNIAHELRSPTVSELKQIMQEKLRLAKLMNTTVLDANTLNVSQNVQWQQVDYNGKKLINICNYSWDEIKNVKINIDDFLSGESINLITKEKYSGNIPLKPFEPVLLEVENPKNETSMKVEFFSNNEKTSILKEGVLSAKIRLEKIGILNEPTAKLVMVLYNKNIVSEVKTKNITLDANTQYNTEFNIELGNIEKNNINDCVVKIFLWTDFETYRPLANIRSIDSFGIS